MQVLVAVQLVGGGPGQARAMSSSPTPWSESTTIVTQCRRPAARTSSRPGRNPRPPRSVPARRAAPGCRPGGLLGAGGGHRGLLIFSHRPRTSGIRRPTAWVRQGIAPLSGSPPGRMSASTTGRCRRLSRSVEEASWWQRPREPGITRRRALRPGCCWSRPRRAGLAGLAGARCGTPHAAPQADPLIALADAARADAALGAAAIAADAGLAERLRAAAWTPAPRTPRRSTRRCAGCDRSGPRAPRRRCRRRPGRRRWRRSGRRRRPRPTRPPQRRAGPAGGPGRRWSASVAACCAGYAAVLVVTMSTVTAGPRVGGRAAGRAGHGARRAVGLLAGGRLPAGRRSANRRATTRWRTGRCAARWSGW